MKEIINHKHTFFIGTMEVELLINYKKPWWTCEIIKGETGCGTMSGGRYKNVEKLIEEAEMQHRYCYNFFNHGYQYAKANL